MLTVKIHDSALGLSGFVSVFWRVYLRGLIHGEFVGQFIGVSGLVSFWGKAYLRGSLSTGGAITDFHGISV